MRSTRGVCPSTPTRAPNYGHVPVDMAIKNSTSKLLGRAPMPENSGSQTPGCSLHQKNASQQRCAIRGTIPRRAKAQSVPKKAVSATNARFPPTNQQGTEVVTYGNGQMSTKPRRETAQPLSTSTDAHTNARFPPVNGGAESAGRGALSSTTSPAPRQGCRRLCR